MLSPPANAFIQPMVCLLWFVCSFMASYEIPKEAPNGKILLFHGVCLEVHSCSDPFQQQEL